MTGLISPPAPIFPQEPSAEEQRARFKVARQTAVDAIKVTTTSGLVFDGNEVSQGRMARRIVALQAAQLSVTAWVLADNSEVVVTLAELQEALLLAGDMQTRLWVAD